MPNAVAVNNRLCATMRKYSRKTKPAAPAPGCAGRTDAKYCKRSRAA
jgi:hypothetical protein